MNSESIETLTQQVIKFRDERDWKQFHNPKDLALSLLLEVAELMELMQWKNGESLSTYLKAKSNEVGEELADILYWLLLIAHELEIDLSASFSRKLLVNAQKYPVETARGISKKYTEIEAEDAGL